MCCCFLIAPPHNTNTYIPAFVGTPFATQGVGRPCVGATPLRLSHAKCACLSSRANALKAYHTTYHYEYHHITNKLRRTKGYVHKTLRLFVLRPPSLLAPLSLHRSSANVVNTKLNDKPCLASVTNVPNALSTH